MAFKVYQTYSADSAIDLFEVMLSDTFAGSAPWPEPPKEYLNILPLTTKDLTNLVSSLSSVPLPFENSNIPWPDIPLLNHTTTQVVCNYTATFGCNTSTAPRIPERTLNSPCPDTDSSAEDLATLTDSSYSPHVVVEVWADPQNYIDIQIV
jgi:hypothetical protein